MALENVTFDVERGVFLARMRHVSLGFPIATLDGEVAWWVEQGWRLGSLAEAYMERSAAEERAETPEAPAAPEEPEVDELDIEQLHMLPEDQRPAEFNNLFKALIRRMAESYNNEDTRSEDAWTAYAMDVTGRYFGPGRLGEVPKDRRAYGAWTKRRDEFEHLPYEKRWEWLEKVSAYPDLASVVGALMKSHRTSSSACG
jgi:hypothetical protein